MIRRSTFVQAVALALLGFAAAPPILAATGVRRAEENALSGVRKSADEHWVGTWSTTMVQPSPGPPQLTNSGFNSQTLRQIVRASVGGNGVRVRLSTFGAGRLVVGAAHIALRAADASIVPGSDRTLTFSNEPNITLPAGATVLSDPVDLDVPPLSDLAVSIFVPEETGPASWHFAAFQTSYVSPPGDFTGSIVMPVASTTQAWFWLAAVEVTSSKQTGAIVALGDSITDGAGSSLNTNNRWPDHLARRLMAQPGNRSMGVLNQGLAGNKVSHDIIGPNAVARFDRDVLTQTGVTHVVVLEGNNDFLFVFAPGEEVHYNQVIEGLKQLIHRAHALGLTIYGATLTPFGGFALSTPDKEVKRRAVNLWIRTGGAFDTVIDFDAVLRDPSDPTRMRPEFDSGDHLHPNDAGYKAMADAIDLKLFGNAGNP
jgi:lysophospholipase L1-like esterase